MVQPAAAQLVERSHEHIVETIPDDEVCGIPVITTVDFIGTFQERLAKSGFPLFMGTGRGRVTFTNPVSGQTVEIRFAGASKDLTATVNGDGTITVRTVVTGMPEEATLPDGAVAIKDVGRVVFVNVIDYNGTPTDTATRSSSPDPSSQFLVRTRNSRATSRCSAQPWSRVLT